MTSCIQCGARRVRSNGRCATCIRRALPRELCPRCGAFSKLYMPLEGQQVCRRCYTQARTRLNTCTRCARPNRHIQRRDGCCVECAKIKTPSECPICHEISTRWDCSKKHCDRCYHRNYRLTHPEYRRELTTPCAHCNRRVRLNHRWEGDLLCTPCYRRASPLVRCAQCGRLDKLVTKVNGCFSCARCASRASRTVGTCACGTTGWLTGPPHRRRCVSCSFAGTVLGTVTAKCLDCDTLIKRRTSGRCEACRNRRALSSMFGDDQGVIPATLLPFVTYLSTWPPRRVRYWLSGLSTDLRLFLRAVALGDELTYEGISFWLQNHGQHRTGAALTNCLDHLYAIVATSNNIPPANLQLQRYERWFERYLMAQLSDSDRLLVRRFTRFDQYRRIQRRQRRLRNPDAPLTHYASEIRVIARLLRFLESRDLSIITCTRRDVDDFLADTSHGVALRASRFLRWAWESGTSSVNLLGEIAKVESCLARATTPELEQIAAAIGDPSHPPRLRLAVALIALHGQRSTAVLALQWRDLLRRTDRVIAVRCGKAVVPAIGPLARIATEILEQDAQSPDAWIFPSRVREGAHLSYKAFRQMLRNAGLIPGQLNMVRLAARDRLMIALPLAIAQALLGYTPQTIRNAARGVISKSHLKYAALLVTQKGS
jgi:integrase